MIVIMRERGARKRYCKVRGQRVRGKTVQTILMAASQFTPDSERGRVVGRTWRKSQNVTFVHFTQALLSVIKHVSSNPRKSEHMLTYRSCQDGPWLGGRGAGSRGQLTLFKTFKQLSQLSMLAQNSCHCRFPSETECYFSNEKNSVGFSFTFPFQMLSSHRISPLWSIHPTSFCSQPRVFARTTHYMLHTLCYTVNTAHAPLEKIMKAWCVIQGTLADFSVKGKYLSW